MHAQLQDIPSYNIVAYYNDHDWIINLDGSSYTVAACSHDHPGWPDSQPPTGMGMRPGMWSCTQTDQYMSHTNISYMTLCTTKFIHKSTHCIQDSHRRWDASSWVKFCARPGHLTLSVVIKLIVHTDMVIMRGHDSEPKLMRRTEKKSHVQVQ